MLQSIDFSDIAEGIIKEVDAIGVLSLSESKNNILMWSHYAGKHTGLCLEFRLSAGMEFFCRAQKVTYTTNYNVPNYFKDQNTITELTLLTKSKDWGYEREWRIFETSGGRRAYRFPPESLTGVIFGCQMLEKNKTKVGEWINAGKCRPRLYEANRKKNAFGLDIEPVE